MVRHVRRAAMSRDESVRGRNVNTRSQTKQSRRVCDASNLAATCTVSSAYS